MELEVKDMTCGHCAGVITKAVKDIDAQAKVDIDVATRMVRIESAHAAGDLLSAIEDAGYTPTVRA
ncbi:heavy-metal-associated domain-containing protein [Paraburkholderia sp. RL18-103-BIB-C]|uniref:heavy-metal-associated domain-containing protein n=1 Tax=unclassified Paraburkholderia TaxID=2615204 RepID=UPI0038BD65F5